MIFEGMALVLRKAMLVMVLVLMLV